MSEVKEKKSKKKMKKGLKVTLITIGSVLLVILVIVLSYLGYVIFSYHRIGDKTLDVNKNAQKSELTTKTTYSAATYNIGFGAYSQDYTFWLDEGYDDEGNKTVGKYATARSKEEVLFNSKGAAQLLQSVNPDFALFQEVDLDGTRSYHVNQFDILKENFPQYDSTFGVNYDSAFLAFPLNDMTGKNKAGLASLSRYAISSSERKEYTISTSFSKFFDLDRCFVTNVIKVDNGKNFYIVNSHMSAYDKGGEIRKKQLQELNDFLRERKENGDYVIVGGDYNHDLLTYNPEYSYDESDHRPYQMTKKSPDWLAQFFNKDGTSPLIDGYRVVASDNLPTCRNNDIEWEEGKTFVCTVDGFIVSDNITIVNKRNLSADNGDKHTKQFAYSDHQPSYIQFQLD